MSPINSSRQAANSPSDPPVGLPQRVMSTGGGSPDGGPTGSGKCPIPRVYPSRRGGAGAGPPPASGRVRLPRRDEGATVGMLQR